MNLPDDVVLALGRLGRLVTLLSVVGVLLWVACDGLGWGRGWVLLPVAAVGLHRLALLAARAP